MDVQCNLQASIMPAKTCTSSHDCPTFYILYTKRFYPEQRTLTGLEATALMNKSFWNLNVVGIKCPNKDFVGSSAKFFIEKIRFRLYNINSMKKTSWQNYTQSKIHASLFL